MTLYFNYDNANRKTHRTNGTGYTYWTYADGLHLSRLTNGQGTVSYNGDGR